MVEARDHKIRALTEQVASLETSLESEQSAVIESLKSTIHQTQEKCSTSERVIAKMKQTEDELQQDLNSAKGIVLDLNDKFLAAKETATKRDSECRKLKMERNSLKNKADSLSKEMLRMSKDNTETLEIEKLKSVIKDLRHVNGDLQRQIEVEKTEKRNALGKLEAAYMAHRQSVNYQLSTDGNHDACISDPRIAELETVISSMTEYLNAKEMQVDTLKQVNETLTKEVNNLSIVERQKK
jgi:chromosome segregation ATPase